MKKFKLKNLLAAGSAAAILLLFGTFMLGGNGWKVAMFTGAAAGAGMLVALLWQGSAKKQRYFGGAAAVLRCAALVMLSAVLVENLVNLSWAATLNTTGFSHNSLLRVTAESDNNSSTVTATGDTITISAKGYDTEGSCGSTNPQTDTVTVTVTNSSDTTAVTYDLEYDGVASEAVTGTGLTLKAGESLTFTIDSNSGASADAKTGTITISNVEQVSSGVKFPTLFKVAAGGTYTVDDALLEEDTTMSKTSDDPYELVATADANHKFYAWMSKDKGIISRDSTFSYRTPEGSNDEIWPMFVRSDSAIYTIQGDSSGMVYGYFDEALTAAGENGTIVVSESGTLYGSTGQNSFTIDVGQKLLVPYKDGDTGKFGTAASPATPDYNNSGGTTIVKPTQFRRLTIPTGTTLYCNGAINVNTTMYLGTFKTTNGAPCGPYGCINLDGGNLILNSGSLLNCYGFIIGSGQVTAESGATVYEFLEVCDYMAGDRTQSITSSSKYNHFPITQYYLQGIEAKFLIKAGAESKLWSGLVASSSPLVKTGTFCGSEGLFRLSEGELLRTYDPSTDRTTYKVNGDMAAASFKLSLVGTIGIDSSQHIMGINSNLTVEAESGTLTVQNDFRFLPESKLIIGKDANLKVNSGAEIYFYDVKDWRTYARAATVQRKNFSPTRTKNNRDISTSAQLIVDGTLEMQSNVYVTAGWSGYLKNTEDTQSSAGDSKTASKIVTGATTGKIINSGTWTEQTVTENLFATGKSYMENGIGKCTIYTIPLVGHLVGQPVDEALGKSYASFAAGTYHSLGNGNWYQYTVDYVNSAGETIAETDYVANACDTSDYTKTISGTVTRDISDQNLIGPGVQSTENCAATIADSVVSVTDVTGNATVTIRAAVAQLMTLANGAVVEVNPYYYTLAEAVTACTPASQYVQMISGSVETDSEINKAVYIDLFGNDVSVKSIANAKMFDSNADDYGVPDGSIKVLGSDTTAVQTEFALTDMSPRYYVKTENTDGSFAFPRVAVHVTGLQFALDTAANTGYLTFRGTFRGSEQTSGSLDDVGFMFNNTASWYKADENRTGALPNTETPHFYYTKPLSEIVMESTVTALMKMKFSSNENDEYFELKSNSVVEVDDLLSQLANAEIPDAVEWTPEQIDAFKTALSEWTTN